MKKNLLYHFSKFQYTINILLGIFILGAIFWGIAMYQIQHQLLFFHTQLERFLASQSHFLSGEHAVKNIYAAAATYINAINNLNGYWHLLNVAGIVIGVGILLLVLLKVLNELFLRNRTEEKIKKYDAKYKTLIENAGAVMYTTDIKGTITFASAKATELTGYATDQIVGKHFSFLVNAIHLNSLFELYSNQIRKALTETVHEFEIVTKDGIVKWVEQSAVLVFDNGQITGFQCVVRDISDKKQMQISLEEYALNLKKNQYYLQSILDNATSLMYIKDLSGKFVMVNKRYKDLFGLTDEMVINKTNYDFVDHELADFYKTLDDKVIATKQPLEIEEVRDTTIGRLSFLSVKFPLLDSDNDVFGISGISTDITERVNYQQQLIDAMQNAEEAKKNAEDAKNMEEQFLANMSHEIRTPMNGIQGMTNLLLDSPLNEQQKEFATIIKRSVNNLLVIINDILDFSKIKAGKLTLETADFNLAEIINNIHSMFAHRIQKKGLKMVVEVNENIPKVLIGDPYRLNQILVNLVGNAIKFTESGFIKVGIDVVETSNQKVTLAFTVADSGIGIHEEAIDHIFESFTQANNSTSRLYGGTGLGLAICKRLVQMLGGDIWVKSTLGEGSTFGFHIPYEFNNEATVVTTHIMGEVDYSTLFHGRRCLVVEDNEVNQKLINYVLKKVGMVVDVANHGKEAIALLAHHNYDFIIMDLQMPVMNGYETTEHIRKNLGLTVPIIALTATVLKGEHDKCIAMGMNDYLSKPFDFDDLYKRLSHLLGVQVVMDNSAIIKEENQVQLYDLCLLKELDDDEYLIDIISMFLDTTPQQISEMQTYMQASEWDKVALLAHKLKGSTGMFQANQLLKMLARIEALVKEGDFSTVADLVQQVASLYVQIETALQSELQNIKNKQ